MDDLKKLEADVESADKAALVAEQESAGYATHAAHWAQYAATCRLEAKRKYRQYLSAQLANAETEADRLVCERSVQDASLAVTDAHEKYIDAVAEYRRCKEYEDRLNGNF